MVEVGRGWHAGTLEVRHEHFASACLSDFLRAAREGAGRRAAAPGAAEVYGQPWPGDGSHRRVIALTAEIRRCGLHGLRAGERDA